MDKPPQNIVINACAGSGKTYQLIQRLLLLLKGGVAPGEILAITFTKKAAEEITNRLLAELHAAAARGEAWAAACRRRLLFAETPADELNIHTFHGWFGTLLSGRNWMDGWYGPADLTEDSASLAQAAWRRFLSRAPAAELAAVMAQCSPYSLQEMMTVGLHGKLNAYRLMDDKTLPPVDVAQASARLREALQAFLVGVDKLSPPPCPDLAETMQVFLAAGEAGGNVEEAALPALTAAVFTGTGTVRKALEKAAEKNGYEDALAQVAAALRARNEADMKNAVHEFHNRMLVLADCYERELRAVKNAEHKMTFDDLEHQVYQAVCARGDVNELLERVNLRLRHILIDEFQDTSPLQWQIIRRWLHAAAGSDAAPSVFIVGDKKQAIYRFRHGDARLLSEAEKFLREHYQAKVDSHNTCRRLSPVLLRLVNETFPALMSDFIPHQPADVNENLPGYAEWHCLMKDDTDKADKTAAPQTPRNPLTEPPAENARRRQWARAVAQKVQHILARWRINDQNTGETRRAREEDILLLLPAFSHARMLRGELQKAGIACSMRGGSVMTLLESFAARDIRALLSALLRQDNELALAKALRSPLFGISDAELAALVARDEANLWQKTRAGMPAIGDALARWRRWLARGDLPAHDLLQRIFRDNETYARYRAAVPRAERRQISDDLSALLDFALTSDSGRRPLAADFLQALDGAGIDEPARGMRVMTIHGAKGLEAPIVILADCAIDKKHSGGDKDSIKMLIDWQPRDAAPQSLVFCPSDKTAPFEDMRARESDLDEVERNNLFYVALTRAKQGLVVFSLEETDNPRALALAAAMQKIAQPAAADGGEELYTLGDSFADESAGKSSDEPPAPDETSPPPPAPPQVTEGHQLPADVARLGREGDVLHRQIALLLCGYDDDAIRRLFPAHQALLERGKRLLQNEQLQELLRMATRHEVEKEITRDGKLLRIDLLLFTPQAIWVVDYKTGGGDVSRYRGQIEGYRAAVAAAYPARAVRAAFLTADGFYEQTD